jgi:simple sugar transport system permease protein
VVHLADDRGCCWCCWWPARGYDGFLSPQVMLNLLIDNAFLLVIAVGMSFVILSGGIDLSVGSVLALTTMMAPGCCRLALAAAAGDRHRAGHGRCFGAAMGAMIHYFKLQPFIVTLAGMFLARGLCYLISINSITIDDPSSWPCRRRAGSADCSSRPAW